MPARITWCPHTLRGYSFEIADHHRILDWAHKNDHEAVVDLDHGLPDEEYEEAILLLFGVRRRCRFIVWRNLSTVIVQPLIGRRKEYRSVRAALQGTLINTPIRQHDLLRV